jgi:hypothetical protein
MIVVEQGLKYGKAQFEPVLSALGLKIAVIIVFAGKN